MEGKLTCPYPQYLLALSQETSWSQKRVGRFKESIANAFYCGYIEEVAALVIDNGCVNIKCPLPSKHSGSKVSIRGLMPPFSAR